MFEGGPQSYPLRRQRVRLPNLNHEYSFRPCPLRPENYMLIVSPPVTESRISTRIVLKNFGRIGNVWRTTTTSCGTAENTKNRSTLVYLISLYVKTPSTFSITNYNYLKPNAIDYPQALKKVIPDTPENQTPVHLREHQIFANKKKTML